MRAIAPRFLLMQAGLKEGDFKTEFAVNPPNAVLALYNKQADAGGAETSYRPAGRKERDQYAGAQGPRSDRTSAFPAVGGEAHHAGEARRVHQSLLVELSRSEEPVSIPKSATTTGMGKAEDKDYDRHRKMTMRYLVNRASLNRSHKHHKVQHGADGHFSGTRGQANAPALCDTHGFQFADWVYKNNF